MSDDFSLNEIDHTIPAKERAKKRSKYDFVPMSDIQPFTEPYKVLSILKSYFPEVKGIRIHPTRPRVYQVKTDSWITGTDIEKMTRFMGNHGSSIRIGTLDHFLLIEWDVTNSWSQNTINEAFPKK